ncbi:hypothetical protein LWS67_10370 [Bacillus atrophaeus]|uniref:hypothetical protein n=1 Tax=Bacillus atrophaeus TaxID=1452 RepID=UPI001EFAA2C5|nr:hypothetical protein [Bacillus atrophaeus]MCG8396971.1 hypothetical protein [Bacillus atrophaeus]
MRRKAAVCSVLFCAITAGTFIMNKYEGRRSTVSVDEWELFFLAEHLTDEIKETESQHIPFEPREYMRIVTR